MSTKTFGSLFAGFGGLDRGLERAGLKCRCQVENNEYANRTQAPGLCLATGSRTVEGNCPVHNFRPDPYPDCPAEVHRNGAAWDDYGFHCAPAQPNPKKEQHDK